MSVGNILRVSFAFFSIVIGGLVSVGTWQSWMQSSLAETTARVVQTYSNTYLILTTSRPDRADTLRLLNADAVLAKLDEQLTAFRESEATALDTIIVQLRSISLPDAEATINQLQSQVEQLRRLHRETAQALTLPKANRPPQLAAAYDKLFNDIVDTVTSLSQRLGAMIHLRNARVDRLLTLYSLAWKTRLAVGSSALMMSNALNGQIQTDAAAQIEGFSGEARGYWSFLQGEASQLSTTQAFKEAVASVNKLYFNPETRAANTQLMQRILRGEKNLMTPDEWAREMRKTYSAIVTTVETVLKMAEAEANERSAAAKTAFSVSLAGLGMTVTALIAALLVITRGVIVPIRTVTTSMHRLAAGDLTVALDVSKRKDEIGGMIEALVVFKDGLQRNRDLEAAAERQRATSDAERRALLDNMLQTFEQSVGGIVDAVAGSARELDHSAKVMSQTAVDTSGRSTAVAAAAEEASSNVTVVASAAEELGASVGEIGRQVRQSAEMSAAAVNEARSTASIVRELSTAADRISHVLGLISTIAGQTNLLALNATIEAARAGEAGKGFAVVAAEVKQLADQTAKATAEISAQINAIQSSTGRAVDAIGGIAETIQQMNHVATMISAAVAEQGAATGEIVRNIAQASAGTSEVTENIVAVAHAANETGAAATQVLDAAAMLSTRSAELRREVDRFVATVKAA
jgi:methyl-accepting chemotaxis protein